MKTSSLSKDEARAVAHCRKLVRIASINVSDGAHRETLGWGWYEMGGATNALEGEGMLKPDTITKKRMKTNIGTIAHAN